MIYAIQVQSQQERHVIQMILKMVNPDILERCYLPYRERLKKLNGQWRIVDEILFEGYVFIETTKPLDLYMQLKKIPKLTKMLYDYDEKQPFFIDLTEKDIQFIEYMIAEGCYLRLSEIRIGPEREIEILSGPLLEFAEQITDINLHKRYANVHMQFLDKEADIYFGIKIAESDR